MKYFSGIISILLFGILLAATCCKYCNNPSTSLPNYNCINTTLYESMNGVNTASYISTNGIGLSLSLDAITYKLGQAVDIVIDEKNMLSKINDVPMSENWLYGDLNLGSKCFSILYPYGVALFRGHYTFINFSTTTPLYLYDPNAKYLCYPPPRVASVFSFNPFSDITNFRQERDEILIKGYWPDKEESQLTNLEPGVYTVVAGDEWGALVILHFTVTQ